MQAMLDERLCFVSASASLQSIFSGDRVDRQSLRLPATRAAFDKCGVLTFRCPPHQLTSWQARHDCRSEQTLSVLAVTTDDSSWLSITFFPASSPRLIVFGSLTQLLQTLYFTASS